MESLNPSIGPNSGPKVTPPKTHTGSKTENTHQEQPKPQNLTEQNLTLHNQQLSNVDNHARAALLDQDTRSVISDLTTRDSDSEIGSIHEDPPIKDDRSVSSLTGSTKASTSSEITIAGGRGLVGPDKKAPLTKRPLVANC